MKIQFLYSKIKEKEKLLNIFEEYQWFVDNDFTIILPRFYAETYSKYKSNKETFTKNLSREFNEVYNKKDYQKRIEKVKNNWLKIEKGLFDVLIDFNGDIKDKYFCYISLYGPEGQFKYPNTINLRTSDDKDIENANETIIHELFHLLIYREAKQMKLTYKQIEGVVDLFFIETKLKTIFPQYKPQNIAIHDKKLFKIINKNIHK